MARVKKNNRTKTSSGANVGYEAELWQMADALRGSMDAAEYKHVVLGLIFLKYTVDGGAGRLRDDKRWTMIYHSVLRTVELD